MTQYQCSDDDEDWRIRQNESLTDILRNEGRKSVEKEILMRFFYGSYKGDYTKYAKAVSRVLITHKINLYDAWDRSRNPVYYNSLKELFYSYLHAKQPIRK